MNEPAFITVKYPSRKKFTLHGQFSVERLEEFLILVVLQDNDVAVVLDQRAILTHSDGKELYSPRRNLDGLHPAVLEWLIEHTEWDR